MNNYDLAIIFSNSVNVTTSKNTWFKLRAALLIDLYDIGCFIIKRDVYTRLNKEFGVSIIVHDRIDFVLKNLK